MCGICVCVSRDVGVHTARPQRTVCNLTTYSLSLSTTPRMMMLKHAQHTKHTPNKDAEEMAEAHSASHLTLPRQGMVMHHTDRQTDGLTRQNGKKGDLCVSLCVYLCVYLCVLSVWCLEVRVLKQRGTNRQSLVLSALSVTLH